MRLSTSDTIFALDEWNVGCDFGLQRIALTEKVRVQQTPKQEKSYKTITILFTKILSPPTSLT